MEHAPQSTDAAGKTPPDREFDGLVCMGGTDWWYHNRGHFCMQMMRKLSRTQRVLYVNSIGVRVPKPAEGRVFFARVGRKLKSWSRGFRRVDEGFGVLSPLSIPGKLGRKVTGRVLHAQVATAARRMGIRKPLFWVECPPGIDVADKWPEAGLVYQRTDRFEAFPEADGELLRGYHERLSARADLTLYCSSELFEEERDGNPTARFLDHGVDFEAFETAGRGEVPEPEDTRDIPKPRAIFVGGLDAHTFDPELFCQVADALNEVQLVLVGGSSLPEGWCDKPNVHLLGRKPYEEVPAYMAAADVLLMPWNRSDWIQACNPVKLKEYLAVGRPVVSTSFPELEKYREHVHIADGAPAFAAAIRKAIADPGDAESRRARVQDSTWVSRAGEALELLEGVGLNAKGRS